MTDSRGCSFCGAQAPDTRIVLRGASGHAICSECLDVYQDIIKANRTFGRPTMIISPGTLARVENLSWLELEAAKHRCTHDADSDSAPLICSFCSGDAGDFEGLIAGPSVYICSGCIVLATAVLLEPQGLHAYARALSPAWSPKVRGHVRRRMADLLWAEWRRRCDAQWAALVAAAKVGGGRATQSAMQTAERVDLALEPEVRDLMTKLAPLHVTVLIFGGSRLQQRELAARLHELSSRQGLIFLDCRDPSVLVHLFEATGGTVVLEDVTAPSIANQCVLWDRLHSSTPPVRIVATADVDAGTLHALVDAQQFSASLYYRLNVITFQL